MVDAEVQFSIIIGLLFAFFGCPILCVLGGLYLSIRNRRYAIRVENARRQIRRRARRRLTRRIDMKAYEEEWFRYLALIHHETNN